MSNDSLPWYDRVRLGGSEGLVRNCVVATVKFQHPQNANVHALCLILGSVNPTSTKQVQGSRSPPES
ncbi:hypothetical protein GCM10025794_30620 [Massilia kyonggiensis]